MEIKLLEMISNFKCGRRNGLNLYSLFKYFVYYNY